MTPRKTKHKKTRTAKRAGAKTAKQTLVGHSGMGGIIGGKGYDYQTRYIVSLVPKLLADLTFTELAPEMTGDVDIRFGNAANPWREHIQVKDHDVTKAEFKGVVGEFAKWDAGMPGAYHRFTLACRQIDKSVRPIAAGLIRVRGAAEFFADKKTALSTTVQEVAERIGRVGLDTHKQLIMEKLGFDTSLSDFSNDERAAAIFISEMHKLTLYENRTSKELVPAYDALCRLVSSRRGQTLNRPQLEQAIATSIRETGGKLPSSIYLDVHNWTRELYKPKADHELDWSKHFDRATRRIPPPDAWGKSLLPELHQLAKTISAKTANRLVQVRGKCCLSTALAVGVAFPENAGWIIEVTQPQMPNSWRSDAVAQTTYPMKPSETALIASGDSIAIIVNVTGKATTEVHDFITNSNMPVKAVICVEPSGLPGSRSITSGAEAVSLAVAIRDCIKGALGRHQVQTTHLFYYGPQGLAMFLGQRLMSLGQIQLYEYQNPGYVPTCLLTT